mgnify:CR=1 FL=1
MKKNNNLNKFISDGFISYDKFLNKKKCEKIYSKILNDRKWGKNLFQPEEDFLSEFKKKKKRTNPGYRGTKNLIKKFDLKFIEKNPLIKRNLNLILGPNYKVMTSKFVVAVPQDWMPDYVKERNKLKLISNFGPYIKKKYRDVTYFRGIDYHMDSIDWFNKDNKFITMYIYLNDIKKNMSPLNIVKKSHIFGSTSFPHFIKDYPNKDYLKYSKNNKIFSKFQKQILIGKSGTVYFWTSNTLHGTAPSKSNVKENFRVSLRFLIKKNIKSKGLIDKLIYNNKVSTTHKKNNKYKRILK